MMRPMNTGFLILEGKLQWANYGRFRYLVSIRFFTSFRTYSTQVALNPSLYSVGGGVRSYFFFAPQTPIGQMPRSIATYLTNYSWEFNP